MHLPTPCKDEHDRIISWVVMLLLLVVKIVNLVGSTVDIRRQIEDNNNLSKHSTAQKKGESRLDYVPLYLHGLPKMTNLRNST